MIKLKTGGLDGLLKPNNIALVTQNEYSNLCDGIISCLATSWILVVVGFSTGLVDIEFLLYLRKS